MKSALGILGAVGLALSASGCIDIDEEFTINPDGSGKVAVQWVHAPFSLQSKGASSDPEEMMREAVREEIEKSDGVDAWKDVAWSLRDDGKVSFKGTAYFKDLSKLRLHLQGFTKDGLRFAFAKEGGAIVITADLGTKKEGGTKPAEKLSEEEVKKKIRAERAQYQQSKPLMEAMLNDLRFRAKLNLPAKVAAVTNFKKASDTALQFSIEGKSMMKVIDDLMMNDEFMAKLSRDGGNFDTLQPDEALNEKFFGEKGPVRAATSGELKPLFDYEKEAATARPLKAELMKKLGGRNALAPPAKGGAFKSLKVGGVRLVSAADSRRGIRPFGESEPGLTLSIVGELPRSVLSVKEGRLEKAMADTGDDLLPENKWKRAIHWPSLTEDKTGVVFDVQLAPPGDKVKGLREVSGTLQYVVAEKTKDVNLGVAEFKAGAKGKELEATVVKVEDSKWNTGHQDLELKVRGRREEIQSIEILDETAAKLEIRMGGASVMGDYVHYTCELKGKFPAKGIIVAKVYQDLKVYEIEFSISNVDLTGKPLK